MGTVRATEGTLENKGLLDCTTLSSQSNTYTTNHPYSLDRAVQNLQKSQKSHLAQI